MKIELFLAPGDKEGILLKKFLQRNNLFFKEIIANDINLLRKTRQNIPSEKNSFLRIRMSHSIHIINGFNPWALKQLLEHIEKYNSKTEKDFRTIIGGKLY